MASRKRHGGFALIEIVVAFTIAAIALSVIFRILGGGSRAGWLATQREQAARVAESLLESALAEENLPTGVHTGRVDVYTWRIAITDMPPPAASREDPLPLQRIDVRLRGLAGDPAREFSLQGVRPRGTPP